MSDKRRDPLTCLLRIADCNFKICFQANLIQFYSISRRTDFFQRIALIDTQFAPNKKERGIIKKK